MCFSYTYTHILFLKLFSIKGYYKVLTIGPCVCVCAQSLSHVRLFVTCGLLSARLLRPWGFSRQEYWSGLHALLRGDSPKPGIESGRPALQADSYRLSPREAHSGGSRLVDTGNGTVSRGQGSYLRKKCQLQRLQERSVLLFP